MTSRDPRWPEVTKEWRHLTGSILKVAVEGQKTLTCCTFHFLQGGRSQKQAVTWQKMTSHYHRWPEVTLKLRHFTGSHLEVPVEGQKLAYNVHFTSYKAIARRRRQSRDRKWRHVASCDRKWPESDVIWPEVTSNGCRRPKTFIYWTFPFLQGYSSQKAVTWQEIRSRDFKWPKVTRKWRHLTWNHLEVAVEGQKHSGTVHFTFYKAVTRRRKQSRDRKWHHVASGDWKWPWSDIIWLEVPASGCRRPKTRIYCTFHILRGSSSQEEAVTWQEMTSCDFRLPEVTLK